MLQVCTSDYCLVIHSLIGIIRFWIDEEPLWDQIQGIIVSKFEYFHPPLVPLHKEGGHQTGFPGSPPTHQHREATLGTLIKRCAIFSSASIITDGLHTTTCGPSLILNVAVRKFWERHGWATGSRCCRGVSAHRVEGVVGNIIHYRIETNKQLSLIILLTLTFIFEPGRVSFRRKASLIPKWFRSFYHTFMLEGGTSRRSDHHQSKANHLSYPFPLLVWSRVGFAFWEVLSPTTGLVGKHGFFVIWQWNLAKRNGKSFSWFN